MHRARYRRIVLFFARLILSLAFWELALPRIGLRRFSARSRPERLRKAAIAYRKLAIQMGGVLIKVGQFLSSRVDVLPPEFTDELKDLQDEVPPADFDAVRRLAEAELGARLDARYEFFDPTPLAAASLGQVHRARLRADAENPAGGRAAVPHDGAATHDLVATHDVVVKVLRPGIEELINTDLAALRTVGRWLNRYGPIRRRANVPALLAEFTRILLQEIDYLAEGRNAETFAANFRIFPGVRVPKVFWTHTTQRTLTLENVLSIKISDLEGIEAAGISRAEVASRLLNTYLKQIFEDGFFHADPHPGNLFIQPLPRPETGASGRSRPTPFVLTFVDFGMVGNVPENLRQGLREMVIGVGLQDARRVIHAYQMMDLLLPSADAALIERATARVFERYWGKNMTELTQVSYQEMRELADEFRELIYSLPFQVPQNVIFLGRCVGILSGMCTGLDPNFNLWEHLAPYARKLIAEEARSGRESWLGELERVGRSLLTVPPKIDAILTRMDRGEVAVRAPEVSQQVQHLEQAMRQVTRGVVFASLLLGGIQLHLGGEDRYALVLLGGAALSLLSLLVSGLRRH